MKHLVTLDAYEEAVEWFRSRTKREHELFLRCETENGLLDRVRFQAENLRAKISTATDPDDGWGKLLLPLDGDGSVRRILKENGVNEELCDKVPESWMLMGLMGNNGWSPKKDALDNMQMHVHCLMRAVRDLEDWREGHEKESAR